MNVAECKSKHKTSLSENIILFTWEPNSLKWYSMNMRKHKQRYRLARESFSGTGVKLNDMHLSLDIRTISIQFNSFQNFNSKGKFTQSLP